MIWTEFPAAISLPSICERSVSTTLEIMQMSCCIFSGLLELGRCQIRQSWMERQGKIALQIWKQISGVVKTLQSSIHLLIPRLWKTLVDSSSTFSFPNYSQPLVFCINIIVKYILPNPFSLLETGNLPIFMPMQLSVSGSVVVLYHKVQGIMSRSGLYGLQLFEWSTALGAFTVDPRPILDAFTVEVVFTRGENGFTPFFVPHQTDRAHFFSLCIFFDVLELIKFVVISHSHLILDRILIVVGLYQCHASLVLLPLLDDPPFNLEPSQCKEVVLPGYEFMHELDEDHKCEDEMKEEDDADERGKAQLRAEIAIERMCICFHPEHEGQEKVRAQNASYCPQSSFYGDFMQSHIQLGNFHNQKVLNSLRKVENSKVQKESN